MRLPLLTPTLLSDVFTNSPNRLDLGARLVFHYGMAERQLIILRHLNQTPALAGCSNCELKFFVPNELMKDPNEARSYLLSKFDQHVCRIAEEQTKTFPRNRW